MPEKPNNQNLHPNFTDLPLYTGIDPEYTPPEPQRSLGERVSAHLESRRFKRQVNRIGASLAAGMLATTGIMVHNSMEDTRQASDMVTADYAPENPNLQYSVVHAAEGVYSRNSPHTEDTPRIAGQGVYNGDTVKLLCGVTNGDAVGENSNNTWHKVQNLSRPDQPDFFLNDYYIASPNVADQLAPGEPYCEGSVETEESLQMGRQGEQLPQEEQKSCYFNFKWSKRNLTFSYEGNHRYYGNAWQAAKNWTDLNAGISITPAPEGQQGDIVFKDVYKKDKDWYAETKIPVETEWMAPHTMPPVEPKIREQSLMIEVNQYAIEDFNLENHPNLKQTTARVSEDFHLDDFGRTYSLTHELGHALGLAHPDAETYRAGCGYDMNSTGSIMKKGDINDVINEKPYNKPQDYEKNAIQKLYVMHGVDGTLENYA